MKEIIFSGCDSVYWKKYGETFVKSFAHYNPEKEIFIQLFNPDKDDLRQIKNLPCKFDAYTFEENFIISLVNKHIEYFNNNTNKIIKNRLKTGMKFAEKNFGYTKLFDKMKQQLTFSTFACYRFIKMLDIWNGKVPIIAYDIDTLCQSQLHIDNILGTSNNGCLTVKGNRFVISLVAFQNNNVFLKTWTSKLLKAFEENEVYGFLDQDKFIETSFEYPVTPISRIYCDHTKKASKSKVFTGKGKTKWGDKFVNAQKLWQ